MVEFREGGGRGSQLAKANFSSASASNSTSNFSTCRFCLRSSSPDHPVMDSLCTDKECIEYSKAACSKTLNCGHFCGGIKDEEVWSFFSFSFKIFNQFLYFLGLPALLTRLFWKRWPSAGCRWYVHDLLHRGLVAFSLHPTGMRSRFPLRMLPPDPRKTLDRSANHIWIQKLSNL